MDDLAGQEHGLIRKPRPSLIRVVDGAVHAVAEPELARQVHFEPSGLKAIARLFDRPDQRAVVVVGQLARDGGLEVEALSEYQRRHQKVEPCPLRSAARRGDVAHVRRKFVKRTQFGHRGAGPQQRQVDVLEVGRIGRRLANRARGRHRPRAASAAPTTRPDRASAGCGTRRRRPWRPAARPQPRAPAARAARHCQGPGRGARDPAPSRRAAAGCRAAAPPTTFRQTPRRPARRPHDASPRVRASSPTGDAHTIGTSPGARPASDRRTDRGSAPEAARRRDASQRRSRQAPSAARNLCTARNRCTRTVDSRIPVIMLTSRGE